MRSSTALLLPAAGWLLFQAGCGSVGEPLPPSFNVPQRIYDLTVIEHGDQLVARFTAPGLTTDNVPVRRLRHVELRIGEKTIQTGITAPGPAHFEVSVADWLGQDITIEVRGAGRSGRFGEWSNRIALRVVPPLTSPTDVKAEAIPTGVKLVWREPAPRPEQTWRIFRRADGEKEPTQAGTSSSPEYIDRAISYGRTYEYTVQAALKAGDAEAESPVSQAVSITPKDVFPPAVPSGLTAIAGIHTVELSWNPDTDSDLRGYHVYRSLEGQEFARTGGLLSTPSYSDHEVEPGKRYRYAVSAIDQNGNESARSAPIEVTAQ